MSFVVFAPDTCKPDEVIVFPANEFHVSGGFLHFPDTDRHYSIEYVEFSVVGNIVYVDKL